MTAVGVFAKPPLPGLVKTRLIPDIGAEAATRVYRFCLEHTLAVVADSGFDFQIFLSETSDDALFAERLTRLQRGADLGSRMHNAMQDLLDAGAAGALIIGSDCLDLEPGHLQAAAAALDEQDLVLLPALDGGYALIGCNRADAELLRDVVWSTEAVMAQTLANARALGYRTSLLETVRDVDTLRDLKNYPDLVRLIAS